MTKKVYLNVVKNSDITHDLQKAIQENKETTVLITVPEGNYTISKTLELRSNTRLTGSGINETKITLEKETNNNMFTNHDYCNGNHDIEVTNICLDGNASQQFKPNQEKRLSFCNIFYFKGCCDIRLINIKAENGKQTAMHFNNSLNIRIKELHTTCMGWSGISASGTDNICVTDAYLFDSGKESRHSAVHFDGGTGSYFRGVIDKCTGNGIMLDSKYSFLSQSVIKATCIDCKRGIAIFGNIKNSVSDVLIKNTRVMNNEVGILASNANNIFISNCEIMNSSQFGVSFQGKKGVFNSYVLDTIFKNNRANINEKLGSYHNYFSGNNVEFRSKNFSTKYKSPPRLVLLSQALKRLMRKFSN